MFGVHLISNHWVNLYLKTDVLLLADVFENFRRKCSSTYSLDPLYYFTAPGLAFDAMLKCAGVQLELLTDADMFVFVERGIRGGVSQSSNRYAQANDRYMPDFDPSKAKYLMYFDVNNLYGAAMSQHLPIGSFEWEHKPIDVTSVPDDALEVDLEYPRELHETHKDLPVCPEHYIPPQSENSKLMTKEKIFFYQFLLPKKKYKIHYRNLTQCLMLGMKLTKIQSFKIQTTSLFERIHTFEYGNERKIEKRIRKKIF